MRFCSTAQAAHGSQRSHMELQMFFFSGCYRVLFGQNGSWTARMVILGLKVSYNLPPQHKEKYSKWEIAVRCHNATKVD